LNAATVNLYSDTQTRHSEGMRKAMAGAEVGDELYTHRSSHPIVAGAGGRRLAEGLTGIDGVSIDPVKVETSIVHFEVADPGALLQALSAAGFEMSRFGPQVRAVTHLDLDGAGIERALAAVATSCGS
jgi:threonine aldolase